MIEVNFCSLKYHLYIFYIVIEKDGLSEGGGGGVQLSCLL